MHESLKNKSDSAMHEITRLANPYLFSLSPFRPGKLPPEILRLGFNENPLGPSPKALTSIKSSLREVSCYPDDDGVDLKEALAAQTLLATENYILGNGASEILEIVARAFIRPGDEIISASPTFPMYQMLAAAFGARNVVVPLRSHKHDLAKMVESVTPRTKLLFVTNPNNPTGTMVGQDEIEAFLSYVPDNVIVVFDEAYIDCISGENVNTPKLLEKKPIIVVRTFSKIRGLAGLRIGYGLATTEIVEILEKVRRPFNTNRLAQAAAIATLEDQQHLAQTLQVVKAGKESLYECLDQLELAYVPSVTNFIFVDLQRNASALCDLLLEQGIHIKPIHTTWARISVGNAAQVAVLTGALERWLGKQSAGRTTLRKVSAPRTSSFSDTQVNPDT